jgi:hypothetical protein
MDKNIKRDLGVVFHEKIESLNQAPRDHVWEKIKEGLNQEKYNDNHYIFLEYKKWAILLFFILFCSIISDLVTNPALRLHAPLSEVKIKMLSTGIVNQQSEMFVPGHGYSFKKKKTLLSLTRLVRQSTKKPSPLPDNPGDLEINNINNSIESLGGGSLLKRVCSSCRTSDKINPVSANKSQLTTGRQLKERDQSIKFSVWERSSNEVLSREISLLSYQKNKMPMLRSNVIYKPDQKLIFENAKLFKLSIPFINGQMTKQRSMPKPNHFFMGVSLAPEMVNYNLKDDESNDYDDRSSIKNRERHLISYSYGWSVGYFISRKIILQTGVNYSSSIINIDPTEVYAVSDNNGNIKYRYNTSSGYGFLSPRFGSTPALGDSLPTESAFHNLRFINIPLVMSYHLVDHRFSFNPGIGISLNYLAKATIQTEINNGGDHEKEIITSLNGLKKISLSLLFQPEVQYNVSKNWTFGLCPYFNYSIAPINKNHIVKTYPYTLGLALREIYHF